MFVQHHERQTPIPDLRDPVLDPKRGAVSGGKARTLHPQFVWEGTTGFADGQRNRRGYLLLDGDKNHAGAHQPPGQGEREARPVRSEFGVKHRVSAHLHPHPRVLADGGQFDRTFPRPATHATRKPTTRACPR